MSKGETVPRRKDRAPRTSTVNEAPNRAPSAPPEELSPETLEYIQAQIDRMLQERLEASRKSSATQPSLWTVQQAADYLNISKRTFEKEINAGRIRPIWIRNQRRFHPDSVEAYVRECARKRR